MTTSPEVDEWFAARDHPLGDAMQRVRRLILEADPRVTESIKWQTPAFAYRGNIASIAEVEQGADELQAVIRAWCDSR